MYSKEMTTNQIRSRSLPSSVPYDPFYMAPGEGLMIDPYSARFFSPEYQPLATRIIEEGNRRRRSFLNWSLGSVFLGLCCSAAIVASYSPRPSPEQQRITGEHTALRSLSSIDSILDTMPLSFENPTLNAHVTTMQTAIHQAIQHQDQYVDSIAQATNVQDTQAKGLGYTGKLVLMLLPVGMAILTALGLYGSVLPSFEADRSSLKGMHAIEEA
jgi:hypothetical protein